MIGMAPHGLPILVTISHCAKSKTRKKLLGGVDLIRADVLLGKPERFMKCDPRWPRMNWLIGGKHREEPGYRQQNDDECFHSVISPNDKSSATRRADCIAAAHG